MADFLLELGTEEIPARLLPGMAQALQQLLLQHLTAASVSFGESQWFATPRRLAVLVQNVADQQPARVQERRGPAIAAAYDDDGQPTKALLGFARSCQVDVTALTTVKTAQGEWVAFKQNVPGVATSTLLPSIIEKAVKEIPLAKPMHWGKAHYLFQRPVHWVVALWGEQVLPVTLFGLQAGRVTYGHRFMANQALSLPNAQAYEETLAQSGRVLADFQRRQQTILQQINALSKNKQPVIEEKLLEEVTGLVEWPQALLCHFDAAFLQVPAEVLISSMKIHQKCFPLQDNHGQLLPQFIAISNIESQDKNKVIAGNERVMRARLSDAAFFYHQDQLQSLDDRLAKLKLILFQDKLGTLYDKTERIQKIVKYLAKELALTKQVKTMVRAAELAKADLATNMVNEFPDLQGIMGEYYARAQQEAPEVALAIREHYLPRNAQDMLPQSMPGTCLALADKIDTLVGIFLLGHLPSGNKDPFALRRNALGCIKIILTKQLPISVIALLKHAIALFPKIKNKQALDQLMDFMTERLRAYCLEQAIAADVFNATLAASTKALANLTDFHARLSAVTDFLQLPQAASLINANKRISNILKDKKIAKPKINKTLLKLPEEKALAESVAKLQKSLPKLNYLQRLQALAQLQKPVDAFFDKVMVMDKNKQLQDNRLNLLAVLRGLFLDIADISLLNP